MSTLGDRIKEIRGRISQAAFADAIGVSQRSVGHYEKNERQPDAETIKNICSEFKVSPSWLLFGEHDAVANGGSSANLLASNDSFADIRALEKEMRQLLKENGDLRVENERLKNQMQALIENRGATAGMIRPGVVGQGR